MRLGMPTRGGRFPPVRLYEEGGPHPGALPDLRRHHLHLLHNPEPPPLSHGPHLATYLCRRRGAESRRGRAPRLFIWRELALDWKRAIRICSEVKRGYQGFPTVAEFREPAALSAVEKVVSSLGKGFLLESYADFLLETDGAFLLPWDDLLTCGICLYGTQEVEAGNELAYSTLAEPIEADKVLYFAVGELTSAASDFIGVGRDGSVWWLDRQRGPIEWESGSGCLRVAGSLLEFVVRLCEEEGSWWWLKGFPKKKN